MTAMCPAGHQSATTDYCDECGMRMSGTTDLGSTTDLSLDPVTKPTPSTGEPCPVCTTARVGRDQFCEECGYDFVARTGGMLSRANASAAATWEIVVTADRAYFDSLDAENIHFPSAYSPQQFTLAAQEVRVGRRSASRNIKLEIDLSGAPEDTGISHLHLQFVRADDGSYAVVDLDSTNGTTVNGGTSIPRGAAVALTDGDRIHLGAWTLITVHCIAGETHG